MHTKKITLALLLLVSSICPMAQSNGQFAQKRENSQVIRMIFDEALSNGECYENLRHLCKQIGARLSGSPQAEKAVVWGKSVLERLGAEVTLQEVMVPHWVRGDETAYLVGSAKELNICALGGSIGTGEDGISAQVVEVGSFEQLQKLGKEKIAGKIVFFNQPMDPKLISTFQAYSRAVGQRVVGAIAAAQYGAVATLVRSLNLRLDDFPHTGTMRYKEGVPKIPAAAISTLDAELLSKLVAQGDVTVRLKMTCQTLPDVLSHNVIGEVKGSQYPDEIIVVGAHLDCWDKGEGAHDDGAGCVQAMEVLRIFRRLGIKPKRTIRVVLFMNEENGLRGGKKYAAEARRQQQNHIAAIESDSGGFTPRGFSIDAPVAKEQQIRNWQPLLAPYGLHDFTSGGSGADIAPLKDGKIALMGYKPDSQRYFDYHHADSDVFEAINKRELEMGTAAIAAMVYLIDEYGL